ncbi:intermembrane phospholipid transport protein YdbH family protein [Sphingomonas sp. ID0503]|uniref:YdbH domain-containing protein n=1 Tax=Sphingomonas sp. ID0503 TaxID=3399691 RepID=UPI003AFB44E5
MAVRLQPKSLLVLILAVLCLVSMALWTMRTPIATGLIARELEKRGVPGRYRVAAIGLRTQVLEDILIGDPRRPDLTARRAEVTLYYGLSGVGVSSIVAEGVRLRGRLVDGAVSFGQVDKLLPAPTGEPFKLPEFAVEIRDTQVVLETPWGVLTNRIEGRGKLSDGFRGRVRSDIPSFAAAGCDAVPLHSDLTLETEANRPHVAGPVMVPALTCGGASLRAPFLGIDARANEALDGGEGSIRLDAAGATAGSVSLGRIAGKATFAGTTERASGGLSFAAQPLQLPQGEARRLALTGTWSSRGGAADLTGKVEVRGAALTRGTLAAATSTLRAAEGTPVGPIGAALATAVGKAGADFDGGAEFTVAHRRTGSVLRLASIDALSASGAQLVTTVGEGLRYDFAAAKTSGALALTLSGGGFPEVAADVRQDAPGGAIEGELRMTPFVVPGGRLAVEPVRFTAVNGAISRFGTVVELDGPVGDGRITGLRAAISGRVSGSGAMLIGEGCQPAGFRQLDIAGASLRDVRLNLCPLYGTALVGVSKNGALGGGIRIDRPRLGGELGGAPLLLTAARVDVPLRHLGFTAQALSVRLGTGKDPTRLDISGLKGDATAAGIAGGFEGAAGKIANVPLVISDGQGEWSLAGAALALKGSLGVDDAQADAPRFRHMTSGDFALTLGNGVIAAGGHLNEPKSGVPVAQVDISHRLADGSGKAVLDVPGITFREKRLQPEALTPLTVGIVANVEGEVHGRGEIRWDARGVSSDGRFGTDGLDLAAAFGPVKGLQGTVHFTDLLGLETPPRQEVRIAEVNPGVAVADGVVRYQLLPGLLVKIESGLWPFAGGDLAFEETTLDFSEAAKRRMVFNVTGLDAGKFIQQLEFENIAATGLFDGTLPMVFDKTGGRIEGGRLTARGEGGTLAYVGEVSNAQLGTFGKMAFDALKSIRYRNLAIELGGPLDGEIVSKVVFNGINQEPLGGVKGFGKSLIGLPFKFNITIRAPFRGLVNTATTFADPTSLIRGNLPAADTNVQRQESETVR